MKLKLNCGFYQQLNMLRLFKNVFVLQLRHHSSTVAEHPTHNLTTTGSHFNKRILKVAIIGLPNAGKSTLINSLMDRKVCPVSNKVHTTRNKSVAIFTEDNAQIIFVDTPGMVNEREQKKYKLDKSFLRDYRVVTNKVDVIAVIHDVSNVWTREKLDIKIINILEKFENKPSFLIFNKIDILKSKRKLLDITRQITHNCLNGKPIPGKPLKEENFGYKGWPNFKDIFMVSALTGDGIETIRNYLVQSAQPGEWLFPEEVWTDQTAESIIKNTVQAALLDFLPQEIPYKLKSQMEYFNVNDEGHINTSVIVHCPTSRIAKLIAGTSDGRLRQIIEKVQRDLQETFYNYVKIHIGLKSN